MGHNVLFVVAEASPLVKVGGLGDVAGSLPRALRHIGHDVRIVMPRYACIDMEGCQSVWQGSFSIPFMGGQEEIVINEVCLKQDGTPVYLIENKSYFDRTAVYGEADDLERFLLFSLAVMEVPKKVGWQPDILHCNDWHAGMVPALLKVAYRDDPFYSSCASVYTIHNLGYQGWFDDLFATRAGLYDYLPPPGDPLRDRAYSMTGLSIYHSDVISTVSETYAREILTPEYGMGLDPLLQKRKDCLYGILNGIDYEQFDPAVDPVLAANYDVDSLDRRVENKLALQERAGLPVSAETPMLGLASRLVEQKGIDILVAALDPLFSEADAQSVLQGTGEPGYEESLRMLQGRYPDKARMFLVPDFSLARLIFAGCDIYLAPSRFEPCGLSHLIAMHYGAVPLVRRVGGLAETIVDYSPELSSGLGFVFERYDASELLATLKRALEVFENKDEWRKLMMRAMNADFSWSAALPKYEALYEMARQEAVKRQHDDSGPGSEIRGPRYCPAEE